MNRRHIILPDLHGNLELLDRDLAHCGFAADRDTIVAAGDMVDVGKDSWKVLMRLVALRAVLLLGNHEFAHIIGDPLFFENNQKAYDSRLDWKHGLPTWLVDLIKEGTMGLAYAVDGVLVTHAGLSEHAYQEALEAAGIAPDRELAAGAFANLLNGLLPGLVHPPLYPKVSPYGSWTPGEYGWSLLGTGQSLTPLWFRPGLDGEPSLRYPQVYGHTPASGLPKHVRVWLEEHDCFTADPWSPEDYGRPGYVKYAIVEDGKIAVVTDWEGREAG